MNEWISIEEEFPSDGNMVLGINAKGWMYTPIRCLYRSSAKVFVLYDPSYLETILVDITHWLRIPIPPQE